MSLTGTPDSIFEKPLLSVPKKATRTVPPAALKLLCRRPTPGTEHGVDHRCGRRRIAVPVRHSRALFSL
jgi:hypothetical protein